MSAFACIPVVLYFCFFFHLFAFFPRQNWHLRCARLGKIRCGHSFCLFAERRLFFGTCFGFSFADVHLTNVAVQKKAPKYTASTGGKLDLRQLKLYLIQKYGSERANQVFFDIQLVVVRALLSVQRVMMQDKHCFELYCSLALVSCLAFLKPLCGGSFSATATTFC